MIQILIGQGELKKLARRIASAKEQQLRLLPALARDLAAGYAKLTKRRILVTKTAPDGTRWRSWATSYAATRSSQHSLLVDTKKLLRSIEHYSAPSGKLASVRTKVPYAGYVQKKRPFLGIGDQERALADKLAERFVRRVLR